MKKTKEPEGCYVLAGQTGHTILVEKSGLCSTAQILNK